MAPKKASKSRHSAASRSPTTAMSSPFENPWESGSYVGQGFVNHEKTLPPPLLPKELADAAWLT